MELKDFVKSVVTDITNAVSELQSELNNGAIVSPSVSNPIANVTIIDPDNKNSNRHISKIDFDVAITVGSSDKLGTDIGTGIRIFSAKIGSDNEERKENVSRITFSIPVVLPTCYVKNKAEIEKESRKRPARPICENDDIDLCTQTRIAIQKQ